VPLVKEFFRGGEIGIGIGSGRCVETEFITVIDLATKEDVEDLFEITE
jgi:hypothetical protein